MEERGKEFLRNGDQKCHGRCEPKRFSVEVVPCKIV